MNDLEFELRLEELMRGIEQCLEDADSAIVAESSGNGVLTLTCPDGGTIRLSRWGDREQLCLVADEDAPDNGRHFNFIEDDGCWVCSQSGEAFDDALAQICEKQAGESPYFNFDL